jgi:hypothetical protein
MDEKLAADIGDAAIVMSDWDCEAYGPEAREVGALCFFSGAPGKRVCDGPPECAAAMAAERQRVFRRIREQAAQGDETMAYLEQEFTRPEQILGGGDQ